MTITCIAFGKVSGEQSERGNFPCLALNPFSFWLWITTGFSFSLCNSTKKWFLDAFTNYGPNCNFSWMSNMYNDYYFKNYITKRKYPLILETCIRIIYGETEIVASFSFSIWEPSFLLLSLGTKQDHAFPSALGKDIIWWLHKYKCGHDYFTQSIKFDFNFLRAICNGSSVIQWLIEKCETNRILWYLRCRYRRDTPCVRLFMKATSLMHSCRFIYTHNLHRLFIIYHYLFAIYTICVYLKIPMNTLFLSAIS